MEKWLLGFTSLALLISVFCSTRAVLANAEEEFSFETVRPKCEQMTQSDILEGAVKLNGHDITLAAYLNDARDDSYNMKWTYQQEYGDSELHVHSDHLYRIIPQELFIHNGEWFFEGEAYSFYINTWKSNTDVDTFISEVMILDKTFSINEDFGEIKIAVSAPFSHKYMTNRLYFDSPYKTELYGASSRTFYLNGVSFSTAISNEHELNYGDGGYTKHNDNGLVITESQLNYDGLYNFSIGFDPTPLIKNQLILF